jgi:chromate transporter
VEAAAARAAWRAALAFLFLWVGFVALVVAVFGVDSTLGRMAWFFSQAALVTFGGAYAVLPYVAEHAVSQFGWLDQGQMLVGMGLAESTPGPLIMVLEYVGFVGAWNHPDGLPPLLAATLGAAITVVVTFLPSFVFVFAGAPHLDRIARWAPARHALTAISAAVLGVIAHLAWWFGRETLFADGQWHAGLSVLVLLLLLLAWRGWSVPLVVVLGALAGFAT